MHFAHTYYFTSINFTLLSVKIMDEIPTWEQLELPELEAIQAMYGGLRLLEDEYLDDCLLDLFEMVMWRVCSRSDTKEASIRLAAHIICRNIHFNR